MYVPNQYHVENKEVIYSFMQQFSFGTLVSNLEGKNYATQTPFYIESINNGESIKLYSHISFHNDQVQSLQENNEVICLFQGPHCYISPSWYKEPNVPTWNYKSVQVTGIIHPLLGDAVKNVMSKMVAYYEAFVEKPMSINQIPLEILNEDLAGIHVFEIEITNIEAAFKLSQNKEEATYLNIIRELKKQDDINSMLIAFEMEQEFKKKKIKNVV